MLGAPCTVYASLEASHELCDLDKGHLQTSFHGRDSTNLLKASHHLPSSSNCFVVPTGVLDGSAVDTAPPATDALTAHADTINGASAMGAASGLAALPTGKAPGQQRLITEGIVPFDGEREMWQSAPPPKRKLTPRTVLAGAFFLVRLCFQA